MKVSISKFRSILLSLWVTISCCVDLRINNVGNNGQGQFFQNAFSMQPFHLFQLILFFALIAVFHYVFSNQNTRARTAPIVIATLFSLFLLIGYSYETTSSMSLIYGLTNGQSLKALIYLSGHIVLFYYLISFLYDRFDAFCSNSLNWERTETHFLSNHTFLKVISILFLFYLPYIIASYPAIFMNDESFQIIQTYPQSGVVSLKYLEGHLLNDAVTLNQHFPVAHTLYISAFVKFGVWAFSSANLGIFIYCLIQMLFLFSGVAYLIQVLERDVHPPQFILWSILAYFVVSPRVHNYMMVTAKDVLYSGFLLFFLSFLAQLLMDKNIRRAYAGISICSIGLYANRNDARYLLIIFFICLILLYRKKFLKFALAGIAAVALVSVVLSSIVFPHFDITPGTRAEMLSVPFQQTARYVRDFGNEVTPDEKESISAVLDYDKLADTYNPGYADPVKLLYDLDSDSGDLKTYFHTWGKMLRKHPAVYLSATLENYYQYVYPSKVVMEPRTYEYSQRCFDIIDPILEDFGVHFSYPSALNGYRRFYQSTCATIERVLPLNVLTIAAAFNWLLILLIGYHLSRKNKAAITFLLYPLFVFLLVFVSPCNGYFCRYTYPLVLIAPELLCSLLLKKQEPQ